MKEKLIRFMQGRYGADQLTKFSMAVLLIVLVVNIFLRNTWVSIAVWVLLIWIYFRMFSRNFAARSKENQWYLKARGKVLGIFRKNSGTYRATPRDKTHKIYVCSGCGQKIRVPKGKGKIAITCPKCHREFIKRT